MNGLLSSLLGALDNNGRKRLQQADEASATNALDSTTEVQRKTELVFESLPPTWVLGLIIAPGLLALVFLAYRHPKRERIRRRIMATLRLGALAIGLFLAFSPFIRESRTQSEPAPLAVLYDDSASLQRSDALPQKIFQELRDAGLTRNSEPKRLDLVKGLAATDWLSVLQERYQLQTYRFAERLAPTPPDASGLTATGAATALGDALLGVVAENRGQRLPDIVVFTDGRSNQGATVETAIQRLSSEGVQVHVVGLGDPRPAPDLALERIQAPEVVLKDDEALFLLRLRATGEDLPSSVDVVLSDDRGREVDREQVAVSGQGGTQVTLTARLTRVGRQVLIAEVAPLPSEIARENNKLELPVEVKDLQIRVLYVDGKPRWEYRFLKERLVRADADLLVQVWLADADRDFFQEKTPDPRLERLRRAPSTIEELQEKYDVIVIGDLDPAELDPDPLVGIRFLESVAEFVRRGGGLMMTGGPRHNPTAYQGSPLEPLLPVILGNEGAPTKEGFRPLPTDPELPHPVTLLHENPRQSYETWQELVPLYWYIPVERLRPGAQAWLVHPTQSNRHGPHIIAAGGYVPEGWVAWLGTDETWRWRFPYEERFLERFWRGILRHLASGRLRGESGRARLDVDRSRIELGEAITVEARLRDEAFQPLILEEGIQVFIDIDGRVRETPLQLNHVPDQPGIYRGRLRGNEIGAWLLYLTEDGFPDGEVQASARFQVVQPSLEWRETSQDSETLTALSQRTGGLRVGIHEADELLRKLDGKDRLSRTLASKDEPIDGMLLLSLFLLLLAAEWLLRKWSNLS